MKNILLLCVISFSLSCIASPVIVSGVTTNTEQSCKNDVSYDVVFSSTFVETAVNMDYSSPFVASEFVYSFMRTSHYNYSFISVSSYTLDVAVMNKGDPNNTILN